jgi:hypothetical protein
MTVRYFDISKQVSAQPAEPKLDLTGATRWLTGEERKLAAAYVGTHGQRHYISPKAAAELTSAFLGAVAGKAKDYFDKGMPHGYELPHVKAKVGLLDTLPHLGWCSFAAVRMAKRDGTPFLIRFHYANFEAQIDTTPGNKMFTLQSNKRSEMFFGVAFSRDPATGETVIDRSIHHSGVSFITDSPRVALDNAIKLRTGVSADEWRSMAGRKAAASKQTAA